MSTYLSQQRILLRALDWQSHAVWTSPTCFQRVWPCSKSCNVLGVVTCGLPQGFFPKSGPSSSHLECLEVKRAPRHTH